MAITTQHQNDLGFDCTWLCQVQECEKDQMCRLSLSLKWMAAGENQSQQTFYLLFFGDCIQSVWDIPACDHESSQPEG